MRVDYDQGKAICETHSCGEIGCGKELVLAWQEDHYDVHCPKHPDSTAFQPRLSYTKARKQGLPIDPYAEQAIKAKEHREMSEKKGTPQFAIVEASTMALVTADKLAPLIAWAKKVRLVPQLGHVIAYHGEPYPTVDGLIYNARRQDPELKYTLEHLSVEERRNIGLDNPDYAVRCTVFSSAGTPLATRLGIVRAHEITERSGKDPSKLRFPIVAAKPIEMAENRAMWDAFMDAYPLGLIRRLPTPTEEPADEPATTRE